MRMKNVIKLPPSYSLQCSVPCTVYTERTDGKTMQNRIEKEINKYDRVQNFNRTASKQKKKKNLIKKKIVEKRQNQKRREKKRHVVIFKQC